MVCSDYGKRGSEERFWQLERFLIRGAHGSMEKLERWRHGKIGEVPNPWGPRRHGKIGEVAAWKNWRGGMGKLERFA